MRFNFFNISLLWLAIFSMTVHADTISKENVPERVFDYIYKKHPDATNLIIEEKTHFGHHLYEVNFSTMHKDQNNQNYEISKLFRMNGHFFADALNMKKQVFNIITDAAKKTLQTYDPNYEILSLKIVTNPNGAGEEYEIELLAQGDKLNISIDDHGRVISQIKLES